MQITDKKGVKITPEMIGLFFEDINFAADGGLYAEMIENRSFEAKEGFGTPGNFYTVDDNGYAWETYAADGQAEPRMQYIMGTPLSEANPHYLRFTATEAGQGFSNKAYDGIRLHKGMKYNVSFYARCVDYAGSDFVISVNKDGKTYAETTVEAVKAIPYVPFSDLKIEMDMKDAVMNAQTEKLKMLDTDKMCRCNDWIKYDAVLTADDDVAGAKFTIALDGAGVIEFDLISMIPEDAVKGIFRRDLYEALAAIKPGFIRFPGGCIVEGISLENRYRWKRTVGELKDRKYIPNLWAFDDDRSKTGWDVKRPDSHYGQSFGIGFYEYFLLCELLGAKALPVLSIGTACQFRSTQLVTSDSEEFDEYVQDALDLIEFANGPVNSKWGALRAKMGHPESFGLDMISVGNEQWESQYVDLYKRHQIFEKAIHEKYPDMRILGTAGPFLDSPITEDAWKFYNNEFKANPNTCYAVDEHYYVSPQWMYDHVDHYDDYPRDIAVFAGEYAAHTTDKQNNMESALAEAALLTGIEKNADVVKLASYAPLFNRIGHSQWKPDMIWFDDEKVYLTPNYYVQMLFANHVGDETIPMNGQEKELRKDGIYVSLSRTQQGETILKVVNVNDSEYTLPLTDGEGVPVEAIAHAWILEGTGEIPEAMPEITDVRETNVQIIGEVTVLAQSVMVLRF